MLFRTLKMAFYFNPRFPWGKRLEALDFSAAMAEFQSTLPVGEATTKYFSYSLSKKISIHASRGGSDESSLLLLNLSIISIHASRGGSDVLAMRFAREYKPFQSTLPVGEATLPVNPERIGIVISIHASRGGSDRPVKKSLCSTFLFQSTLPVGEATVQPVKRVAVRCISIHASRGGSDIIKMIGFAATKISIHASRGGSDVVLFFSILHLRDFNPRFPWGKRPLIFGGIPSVPIFQSTLPVGEATLYSVQN